MLLALLILLAYLVFQPAPKPVTIAQPPAPAPPAAKQPAPAAPAANTATQPAARTDDFWVKRNDSFTKRAEKGSEEGDIGVVFLGDSITEGWEGAGKQVWAKAYAPRHAVNFGIGGDRTQHVLWRIQNGNLEGLDKPGKGQAPKLAIIMIGTNNIGGNTAPQIAEGIGAVVRATREKLPETKVLLLGVFPRAQKADDRARPIIKAINEQVSKLGDGKTVFFEDIGAKFLSDDGSLSPEIMPDFLHLSPRGYQIWADAIEARVAELLGETPAKPAPPSKPGTVRDEPRTK